MVGEHLETYTFEYLLGLGLSEAPDTVDKREGSPVYDSAAMMARQLERGFQEMKQLYQDTFARYAGGDPLALRAAEGGVNRRKATKAVRKGVFTGSDDLPYSLPVGARFSAMGEDIVNYVVTEEIEPGICRMECETAGTAGNSYLGELLPIEVRSGLKTAVLSDILIPGEDAESDEELRERFFAEKNSRKFGGNVDQYRDLMMEQDGVGACQIYPVWNGGGTVKVSFVDSTFHAASEEHVAAVQQVLDPTQDGQGIGLAPIDHIVTVVTPDERVIDISAVVQTAGGYTVSQLKPLIEAEIGKYFAQVRADWGKPAGKNKNVYEQAIFRSQVIAAILRAEGVVNVTGLTLSGGDADVRLLENAQVQELPKLGVVSLA